ncbi:hypothetical protein KIN20_001990 [Parelaphostrongylus tenuis]|uniref:Uncharacterized protein n=1 Tax=Parelaphostrongylus tenuis TaxID=148309 RepID=A0AAD5LX17_PARTN|nr:hypothetical protein KIN20_001990 [Parelaphostrongylus tenuis]
MELVETIRLSIGGKFLDTGAIVRTPATNLQMMQQVVRVSTVFRSKVDAPVLGLCPLLHRDIVDISTIIFCILSAQEQMDKCLGFLGEMPNNPYRNDSIRTSIKKANILEQQQSNSK